MLCVGGTGAGADLEDDPGLSGSSIGGCVEFCVAGTCGAGAVSCATSDSDNGPTASANAVTNPISRAEIRFIGPPSITELKPRPAVAELAPVPELPLQVLPAEERRFVRRPGTPEIFATTCSCAST